MQDIYSQTLKKYWGYDDFRGIQRQIIESICAGHDTLGLMPTGGGKSITFQVPAMIKEGLCIVITPLVALMKDQVEHLRAKGILATYIHSGLSHDRIITSLENCILGNYKFLYVSPERLGSELFIQKLRHMNVSFICVDEAHCISQWGYDFRPSYLQIKSIRKEKPNAPILALTATATQDVITDIQHQLDFREECVFRMSFVRHNLTYTIVHDLQKFDTLLDLLQQTTGSTIIYTRNRRQCYELTELIKQHGHSVTFYHAGLNHAEKDERQNYWQQDKIRIMVATNAFGMGIDKPDVRQVIHMELPDSIEAYFQEAGRAGRDGQPATAYLIYSEKDKQKLLKRIPENFPEKDTIRQIYEHLCYYYQIAEGFGMGVRREFNIGEFCHYFKHEMLIVHSALNILTKCGYIEYTDADEGVSRVMFTLKREELYRLREQDRATEDVINNMLRKNSGMFIDYAYIDESLIAKEVGRTPVEVYHILVELNKRHILHYIPRKNIPHVAYTRSREAAERLYIPTEVYERRKAEYEKRIHAIIDYVEKDETCRNKTLLAYFGEVVEEDCNHCDVCQNKSFTGYPEEEKNQIRESLIKQIIEAKEIFPFDLNIRPTQKELASNILSEMMKEEEIECTENGKIRLTQRAK